MLSRPWRLLVLVVPLCLAGIGGFFLGQASKTPVGPDLTPTIRESSISYHYIRPLLICDSLHDTEAEEYSEIKTAMNAYIAEQKKAGDVDDVAVYFRDLSNGAWTGINPDETFDPASLLKIPIMIAAFRQADLGSDILDRLITVPIDFPPQVQTIPPSQSIQNGSNYTVEELIRYMIEYSDNRAKDLVFAQLDPTVFSAVLFDLGVTDLLRGDGVYAISPRNYSLFFRILYNGTYLSRKKSERALSYLAASDFDAGLASGLPTGTIIADKFGEFWEENGQVKELHDCGIIYGPTKDYALCVMTRGNTVSALEQTMSGLSQLTYDFLK